MMSSLICVTLDFGILVIGEKFAWSVRVSMKHLLTDVLDLSSFLRVDAHQRLYTTLAITVFTQLLDLFLDFRQFLLMPLSEIVEEAVDLDHLLLLALLELVEKGGIRRMTRWEDHVE